MAGGFRVPTNEENTICKLSIATSHVMNGNSWHAEGSSDGSLIRSATYSVHPDPLQSLLLHLLPERQLRLFDPSALEQLTMLCQRYLSLIGLMSQNMPDTWTTPNCVGQLPLPLTNYDGVPDKTPTDSCNSTMVDKYR